jgi:hypothetical protein
MLTDDHNKNRVAAAQAFLTHYKDQGDDFLDRIVTGDETWVSHHTPETKRQSVQWRHTHTHQHHQTEKSWQSFSGTGRGHFSSIFCLEETPSMLLLTVRR